VSDQGAGQRASDWSAAGVELGPDLGRGAVLLLSGGMDSAALAAWLRPSVGLFIDYGQRPAQAERRASLAVAEAVGVRFAEIHIDLSVIGSGLLRSEVAGPSGPGDGGATAYGDGASDDEDRVPTSVVSPSPEWWPLRNQLLCSIAAAWALGDGMPGRADAPTLTSVMTASVLGDGARHADGTPAFYDALDAVTSMQEGGIRVMAPVAHLAATDLVRASGIEESVLGWTHSCHRSNVPCAACPGCWKREQVLYETDMLGHHIPGSAAQAGSL
jgi:7-cyano-7-deazaguanine synthase